MPNNQSSNHQESNFDDDEGRSARWNRCMDICIVFCFLCLVVSGVTTWYGHRSVAYGAIVGFILGGLTIGWMLSLPVTLARRVEKARKE